SPTKSGRSRFYGPREVARMTLILRARRFGFSLEEIRQWLLIYDEQGREAQMAALVGLADRQLKVLRDQRTQLDASIEELQTLRDAAATGQA
ncbi:MerR family DNA-binding protein, partial [Rhodovulum sulfidophilum]|nr:MerR family DNA-binding protein [Rhodovulum sulfidophilum]